MPPAQLIAFDIDQTLTESKTTIDTEMAGLLLRLVKEKRIAIVSGAPLSQCLEQVVNKIGCTPEELQNVSIIPTNGAALYTYSDGWHAVYEELLTLEEKKSILDAFEQAFVATHFEKENPDARGPIIEDRGSQITFSALGSNGPLELKMKWDPDFSKRKAMVAVITPLLSGFSISMGGATSIDVTRKGITKAMGLSRLAAHLHISLQDVLYVGDALFPGGNDSSVTSLGVRTASVAIPGLDDTKALLKGWFTDLV
ncbi:MAG: HAD-IIB family hydrolase [Candidatus Campbellbacteria bacterium]|nr:HAD-IIB family hydrolase [Candidatus Campbellbacteria bacterium]